MKKIVIIAMKKSNFINSWVWKYINNYIPYLSKKYDVVMLYQPEETWFLSWWYRRFFKLPRILKNNYRWYIKIFTEENFLVSCRQYFADDTIVIIHHYPFRTKVTNFKEEIIRRLSFFTFNTILKRLKNIIAVSKMTKSVLDSIWIKEKYITVIPNSVDLSSYKRLSDNERAEKRLEISKKYNISNDKKWLLYVWSNESRKNLLTLFKVLANLSDDFILVRIWKDWSTEELQKMNKIIKDNNLKDRYYHLQNLSEEDLISLYQVSDIYLMPSLYEWFGRPIIEAQACWCPVISTKCWALEEICWDWALLVDNPMNENEYINNVNKIYSEAPSLIKKWKINADKYSASNNGHLFIEIIEKI